MTIVLLDIKEFAFQSNLKNIFEMVQFEDNLRYLITLFCTENILEIHVWLLGVPMLSNF